MPAFMPAELIYTCLFINILGYISDIFPSCLSIFGGEQAWDIVIISNKGLIHYYFPGIVI